MIQPEMFNPNGDPSAECSRVALEKVDTARLRNLVEAEYAALPAGAIADEVVYSLRAKGHRVDYLSIRPRVSELKALGVLRATGARRLNRKDSTCAVLIHFKYWISQ